MNKVWALQRTTQACHSTNASIQGLNFSTENLSTFVTNSVRLNSLNENFAYSPMFITWTALIFNHEP